MVTTQYKPLPPPDRSRKVYIQEYIERGVFYLQWRESGRIVSLDEYVELRQRGAWRELAEREFPRWARKVYGGEDG